MKRSAMLLVLVVLTALVAACTPKDNTPGTPTPQGETATPSPLATTPPDYPADDFIGIWAVSALYDSNGGAIGADKFAEMNANFTLELAADGKYFLYDPAGKLLGQGQYSVAEGQLALNAGAEQTSYAIVDTGMLRCTAPDGSVTVMTKCADAEEDDGGDEEPPEDTGAEPSDTEPSEVPDA